MATKAAMAARVAYQRHATSLLGLSLAMHLTACVVTADDMILMGSLTDFDGYATNVNLTVMVDAGTSRTQWKWVWDHDASGNKNVPIDQNCTLFMDATTVTACNDTSYYWFKGSWSKGDTWTQWQGGMFNEHGESVGEWNAHVGNVPPPPNASAPVQVHLALGVSPASMAVAWSTYDTTPPAPGHVVWSASKDMSSSSIAVGDVRPFTVDSGRVWYTHTANMTGLQASTRYWYNVVSANNESSKVFSFQTQPDASTLSSTLPELHLIYGDMGAADAFTLCSTCSGHSNVCDATTCATANQSAGLISELDSASLIVHVGDFAYNLEDGGGTVGDQFMANIEQVAAYIPYMVSIGNHENAAGSLAHFTERFRHVPSNSGMVATSNKPSSAKNNWFYSWDAGLVHYIAISTELYFGVSAPGTDGVLDQMYAWLEADLTKAQLNRKHVPWIVVHGHRSIYCSCDSDCDKDAYVVRDGIDGKYGLEELLFKHGVDFFFNGHEHDYERTWPVYNGTSDQSNINPKATIYVVTGSAGSHELHEPFTRAQPEWSSFRSNTFGYSRMYIHNATHVRWQQVQTDPTLFGPALYGRVIDDVWIVQENHGPFSLSDPPSGKCPTTGCKSGTSYDHWLPLLNFTESHNVDPMHVASKFKGNEHELIQQYRNHNAQGKWKRTELNLLAKARAELGNGIWEDVHVDGNSDGKWEEWRQDSS